MRMTKTRQFANDELTEFKPFIRRLPEFKVFFRKFFSFSKFLDFLKKKFAVFYKVFRKFFEIFENTFEKQFLLYFKFWWWASRATLIAFSWTSSRSSTCPSSANFGHVLYYVVCDYDEAQEAWSNTSTSLTAGKKSSRQGRQGRG